MGKDLVRAEVRDAVKKAPSHRAAGEGGGRWLRGSHDAIPGGRAPSQQALAPRVMWMAEDDGAPIGYIAGHLTRRFGCDGELHWIYVVREHRGTEVASELLRRLAAWLVERSAPRVCVDVGDEQAGRFYKRHGAEDLAKHWLVWNDIGTVLRDRGRS